MKLPIALFDHYAEEFGYRDREGFEAWYAREVAPDPAAWGRRAAHFMLREAEKAHGSTLPPDTLATIASEAQATATVFGALANLAAEGFAAVVEERRVGVVDLAKRRRS